MASSLTIDRTTLSLPPLVIPMGLPVDGFWIDEEGIEDPTFEWVVKRLTSDFQNGSTKLSARQDMSAIPCRIYVQSDSAAGLSALKAELTTALAQWTYDVTLTVDDVANTYEADLSSPAWGALDSGMVGAHLARAAVTIPVNQGA